MAKERDYTKGSFIVSIIVIIILVALIAIPPFKIGNTVIKRSNILSDIIPFEDDFITTISSESLIDTSFLADFSLEDIKRVAGEAAADKPAESAAGQDGAPAVAAKETPADKFSSSPDAARNAVVRDTSAYTLPDVTGGNLVPIQDYSEGRKMMSRFYHSLAYDTKKRPVRIAMLGDSFTEADIITGDMREQLQLVYGGGGVGFVPFATSLSKHRGTVKHTYDGWEMYNIIKRKSVPDEYKDWFFVSGMLNIPKEGARSEYRGVKFRKRIESAGSASLLFVNRGNTKLTVTVNDSLTTTYAPPSSNSVQQLKLKETNISNLSVRISDPEGFIGYGVVLEDRTGVSVHNFSVRSNSGTALFGTNYNVNTQINSLMDYDMIILQYGLNAMSPDVLEYGYYGRQLVRIIEYIKLCFPNSAIVVMSVGDRSTLKSGSAVTMPAVEAMIRTQRNAAIEAGVGFWNTYEAMGGKNSMAEFVERKWAAPDHTHISYPGGKYIAGKFVSYLNAAVGSVRELDDLAREEKRKQDSIEMADKLLRTDSVRKAQRRTTLRDTVIDESTIRKIFDDLEDIINEDYRDMYPGGGPGPQRDGATDGTGNTPLMEIFGEALPSEKLRVGRGKAAQPGRTHDTTSPGAFPGVTTG